MGDAKPTKSLDKSVTIKCPMLNSSNYTVWAMRMKILLKVNKAWEVIETGKDNGDKNDIATAMLFQSIPEALILQVGELDTAKKVWEAIKARHVGADRVKEARLQTLMAEFDRLKMKETEKVDDFAGKLSEISTKSMALGEEIEESKIVKKFLSSLPRKKYIHIVASLEQVLDLKNTSFEDIIGRLKAYEERISEEEETQEDQSQLMYSKEESHETQTNHDNNRGYRGRGGHFNNRGRGRGRYNEPRDLSEVECFRCDKYGHYASNCPDRLLKLQEAEENEKRDTEDANELMMHEVVYLNEEKVVPRKFEIKTGEDDVWYLDNGASNHMSGDRRYFSELDESITGKVKFGDDSHIDIKGKGSIEFVDWNGEERTMTDVYFIPDLKSNIVSLGQATESGCEVRMKGEYLTMIDRNGELLVKATRSRNRLYKVCMGLIGEIPHLKKLDDRVVEEREAEREADDVVDREALDVVCVVDNGSETEEVDVGVEDQSQSVLRDEEERERLLLCLKNEPKDLDEARECVENGQVEVEHVPVNEQKADILTKALGRIKFKEMRDLIGVQDVTNGDFKLKGENVGISLKTT